VTNEQLAYEIAKGIGQTGVEGGYNSVTRSTAGDYPSMGMSQWEGLGGRGDSLLSYIDGGNHFSGRTYSDIKYSGELPTLKALLDSRQGQEAQNQILARDCLEMYVPALKQVSTLDDSRCFIYAGIWCPTSHVVVRRFLQNRYDRCNIRSLATLRDIFRDQYYIAAAVGIENARGYANRAENTYQYVAGVDLSAYGVPEYGNGPFGR
jgi:hypothetical protein